MSGAASPEVDKRSEGNLTGREGAMGAETTTQRPKISRRQLFKYGASAGPRRPWLRCFPP